MIDHADLNYFPSLNHKITNLFLHVSSSRFINSNNIITILRKSAICQVTLIDAITVSIHARDYVVQDVNELFTARESVRGHIGNLYISLLVPLNSPAMMVVFVLVLLIILFRTVDRKWIDL